LDERLNKTILLCFKNSSRAIVCTRPTLFFQCQQICPY